MAKSSSQCNIELSSAQHGCIGALVGSTEQAIMRPTVYWKAELQQGRFTPARALDPRFCYRGLAVAVASIAPITCIQFAATNVFLNALQSSRGAKTREVISDSDTILAGVFAGATSSLVQTPFQLVEINQQRHGGNTAAMTKRILTQRGLRGFYRGGSMTAIREGIFCSSYMGIAPYLRKTLLRERPETSEATAMAASSIAAGSFGALLSHPADTLKSRLQGSTLDLQHASGPREALRGLSLGQCFAGFTPRVFRICCCTFIYGSLTEVLTSSLREWNARSLDLETEPKTGFAVAAQA